jgi:Tfp pilus assembly protein PilF
MAPESPCCDKFFISYRSPQEEILVKTFFYIISTLLFGNFLISPYSAYADQNEPLNPYANPALELKANEEDAEKSVQELVAEATHLLDNTLESHPIDGRSKLLLALKKDPSFYPAHMLLAHYYMYYVGHFRLAFKYIDRAINLFKAEYGPPPYTDRIRKAEHARLLDILAHIRLDLDNYQGALDTLDEFSSYGYYSPGNAGTRAWILMKLGRIEDAIKVSRMGLLLGSDSGRTLNMLGILLSMNGEPEAALKVLQQALQYELSVSGQPSTPLNNSGEVYRELYKEDKAESAWVQAKSLTDGCEHVLPSLNLALLYIDQTRYQNASGSIDSFLSCFSQYTLNNGEEHRALVHLARGRLAIHAGSPELGAVHLEKALEDIQWFGKIGTSKNDLKAAGLTSLAVSLEFINNQRSQTPEESWISTLTSLKNSLVDKMRVWWLKRRALQILIEDLDNIQDLRIRSTDSLLEYPTLGAVLRNIPPSTLQRRVEYEKKKDKRSESLPYYEAYLAESLLEHGAVKSGITQIRSVLTTLRPVFDDGLRLHLSALLLQNLTVNSDEYAQLAAEVYELAPSAVYNYGLKFPVAIEENSRQHIPSLASSPFVSVAESNSLGILSAIVDEKGISIKLRTSRGTANATDKQEDRALTKLIKKVFSEDLGLWLQTERKKALIF